MTYDVTGSVGWNKYWYPQVWGRIFNNNETMPCRQRDLFYKYLLSAVRFCASGAIVLIRVYRCLFTLRIYFSLILYAWICSVQGWYCGPRVVQNVHCSPFDFTLYPFREVGVAVCPWTGLSQKDNVTKCVMQFGGGGGCCLGRARSLEKREQGQWCATVVALLCLCLCLWSRPPPPPRCVGFIGRRRRRSPELNELTRSGARTHV
jgi:hypothetical protein